MEAKQKVNGSNYVFFQKEALLKAFERQIMHSKEIFQRSFWIFGKAKQFTRTTEAKRKRNGSKTEANPKCLSVGRGSF